MTVPIVNTVTVYTYKTTFTVFHFFIFVVRTYDAAKEEHHQQEAKQKELQHIEEALQMAARRGETD